MRLVVVGGGIAGLAAAHRAGEIARDRGIALELTLLEARERLGGTIATERMGGFLVEAGPHSFPSGKPRALALCQRLRVRERPTPPGHRVRQGYPRRAGRLHPPPHGVPHLP